MCVEKSKHDETERMVPMTKDAKSQEKKDEVRRLNNKFHADRKNGKFHKTVKKLDETELGMGETIIARAIALYPGQVDAQIDYVFDHQRVFAAIGKTRPLGETTLQNYRERTKSYFRRKARLNMRSNSILEITTKQNRLVFEDMKAEGLNVGYMANVNTTMRRFCLWLKKPDVCPPMEYIFPDKADRTRKLSATERKDWGDDQEEIGEIIAAVEKDCQVAGCVLDLAWNFGLRVREALQLRPKESIRGSLLHIKRGTKGGRPRVVPIETQEQLEVLARCTEIAEDDKEGVMRHKPGINYRQTLNHFRYIVRKNDVTRNGRGKTPHGLRHQFANDQYEFKTKHKSPVRGGGVVDPEVLGYAKREISEVLGHSRESITAMYTGNCRNMTRVAKENVEKLIMKLEGDEPLKGLVNQLGASAIYVCGGHADGEAVKPISTVLMSVDMGDQSIPQDVEFRMTRRAKQILGCKVVGLCNNETLSVNLSRLELVRLAAGGGAAGAISGQVN